jgi:hypothetical protein
MTPAEAEHPNKGLQLPLEISSVVVTVPHAGYFKVDHRIGGARHRANPAAPTELYQITTCSGSAG